MGNVCSGRTSMLIRYTEDKFVESSYHKECYDFALKEEKFDDYAIKQGIVHGFFILLVGNIERRESPAYSIHVLQR